MIRRLLVLLPLLLWALAAPAADTLPPDLMARTRAEVARFVKVFSDVRCTEDVTQARLTKKGKIEHVEKSTYDYLVIAEESGSSLSLHESRLEQKAPAKKSNTSLLVTNGFATLLLIFHPSYADSFEFSAPVPEMVDGQTLARVEFRHRANKPSTMELVLRGREYPIDLRGTAWIEPASGSIVRIDAQLAQSMDDLGLRILHTDVQYAPVPLRGVEASLRLPSVATIEVETARQHWRNVHRFSGYQRFSVDVEETVRAQK